MRIKANKEIVYGAVSRCLNQLVEDIDKGELGKDYMIQFIVDKETKNSVESDIFKMPIKRPEVVYNSVYDNGLEATIESFTENLLKNINHQM